MNRKKYKVDQSPDDNSKDIDITIFWHESIPQSSKNITDRLNNSVYRLKVNKELEALNRCLLRANKLIRSPEKVDNYYANSSVDKKVELISVSTICHITRPQRNNVSVKKFLTECRKQPKCSARYKPGNF
ncbi:hypothetical protein A3Q56_06395 [Intoshia linei]|uniref:Uncharacterized protein n=1 Tax=Intoshia linei TaxID=1819745 RepID=A0A177AV40_9BILA|nr:hypothetical protein A3Q56_06395 [Intoshia linei]